MVMEQASNVTQFKPIKAKLFSIEHMLQSCLPDNSGWSRIEQQLRGPTKVAFAVECARSGTDKQQSSLPVPIIASSSGPRIMWANRETGFKLKRHPPGCYHYDHPPTLTAAVPHSQPVVAYIIHCAREHGCFRYMWIHPSIHSFIGPSVHAVWVNGLDHATWLAPCCCHRGHRARLVVCSSSLMNIAH